MFCPFIIISKSSSETYTTVTILFMDSSAFNALTLIEQQPAADFLGHQLAPTNIPLQMYKEPGYSTSNLNLIELLTKPQVLPAITIDSSFSAFEYAISAFQPMVHQWIPKFLQNFVSPIFDLQLEFHIPAHQFAVAKFGATYCPTMNGISSLSITPPGAVLPITFDLSRTDRKYNFIRATGGAFFNISESSQCVKVTAILPRNTPMNPLDRDDINNSLMYGSIILLNVTDLRFGLDLTSFQIRPFVRMINVSLMPWRH